MSDSVNASEVSVTGTLTGSLKRVLLSPDIEPGSDPSYELCKLIYLYHPLGAKLAEAPIKLAQSIPREVTVQNAPEEVAKAFNDEWVAEGANNQILNVKALSRVYGISAIVLGIKGKDSNAPVDMTKIYDQDIYFTVFDPLNAAGSLVVSQDPTDPMFQKVQDVTVSGDTYHKSRCVVVMNENPVYLSYTNSAYGYSGRSVYQRTLYPLKAFIRTMIADEMIARKSGLLIAMMEVGSNIIEQAMNVVMGIKRTLLRQAETDNVISIGLNEKIETLNMMNVDGAGTFARDNIINNIATGANMPSVIIRNETYVSGFAEGEEDSKNVVQYINDFRTELAPIYAWFDTITMYRAWNPAFFKVMQQKYPAQYGKMKFEEAFSQWREDYVAKWPSLMPEPESELVTQEGIKLKGITDTLTAMLPAMDPENKAIVLQWAADNISENKTMFPHELVLNMDALKKFHEEQGEMANDMQKQQLEAGNAAAQGAGSGEGAEGASGNAAKPGGGGKPANGSGGEKVVPMKKPGGKDT